MKNLTENGFILNGLAIGDYFNLINLFFKNGCLIADDLNSITGWNNYWIDIFLENKEIYKYLTSADNPPPATEALFDFEKIIIPNQNIYKITPVNESAFWEISGLICSGNGYSFILIDSCLIDDCTRGMIDIFFNEKIDKKSISKIDELLTFSGSKILSGLSTEDSTERVIFFEKSNDKIFINNFLKKSNNKTALIKKFGKNV